MEVSEESSHPPSVAALAAGKGVSWKLLLFMPSKTK
jgi:hypothetical protein